ncbi:hypothetical protein C8R46DRAFT_384252 [Mycena filopes]|nr:hypothetical protein C8R46DRAFT_384252 [Mycena filopes]
MTSTPPSSLPETSVSSVHVVGLLGATDLEDDEWLATDFLAWKDLFTLSEGDARSHGLNIISSWTAAVDLSSGDHLKFGDPQAERLLLSARVADGVSVVSEHDLKLQFMINVGETVGRATTDDLVVIVICGHGSPGTGDIAVGDDILTRANLELAVRNMQVRPDRLFVISTACFSGLWTSDRWTLFSGAKAEQESISMPTSGSGQCRYPTPSSTVQNPQPTLPQAIQWTSDLRRAMGELFASAQFTLCPDIPLARIPLRRFVEEHADRFISTNRGSQRVTSISRPPPPALSLDEVAELMALMALAKLFLAIPRINTGTSNPAISLSTKVVSGAALSSERQWKALRILRSWARECQRANVVAAYMRWEFPHSAERWNKLHGIKEMQEAEAAGARIYTDFFACASARNVVSGARGVACRCLGTSGP